MILVIRDAYGDLKWLIVIFIKNIISSKDAGYKLIKAINYFKLILNQIASTYKHEF